jgi:hypothetical protein
MSQCSKQILHFQCSTSVMANVTGDWTVAWLSLSICSFSTKIKSTLLRIMEIKVLVQTKTSLAQIHVFCDTFAVPQTCLFLKPGFWIVWQIQDLLCWNVHLEANTKMTPQMFVNSLSLYEHSGVLWWQFTAHTWNITHSYCLKFLALAKGNEKNVNLEDLTIQWWRNGQNNCKYLCT